MERERERRGARDWAVLHPSIPVSAPVYVYCAGGRFVSCLTLKILNLSLSYHVGIQPQDRDAKRDAGTHSLDAVHALRKWTRQGEFSLAGGLCELICDREG